MSQETSVHSPAPWLSQGAQCPRLFPAASVTNSVVCTFVHSLTIIIMRQKCIKYKINISHCIIVFSVQVGAKGA